ncbi:MAG: hypothetical protein ACF8PN_14965 [Phycisphaerales bacterium]
MRRVREALGYASEWLDEARRILPHDPPCTLLGLVGDIEGRLDVAMRAIGDCETVETETTTQEPGPSTLFEMDACLGQACELVGWAWRESRRAQPRIAELVGALQTVRFELLPHFKTLAVAEDEPVPRRSKRRSRSVFFDRLQSRSSDWPEL